MNLHADHRHDVEVDAAGKPFALLGSMDPKLPLSSSCSAHRRFSG